MSITGQHTVSPPTVYADTHSWLGIVVLVVFFALITSVIL